MWQAIRDAVKEHPLEVGESTRVRHDDCEHRHNGTTLDIVRKDDGYFGYCFRCDVGGAYRGATATYKRTKQTVQGGTKRKYKKSERTSQYSEFPMEVRIWLNKSRVPRGIIESQGVQYNKTLLRLEFPVPGYSQTVNRNYGTDERTGEKLAKYTSRVPYQLRNGSVGDVRANTLVVVEDWLSCLQCALAGYSSLALFTTSIKQDALVLVAKQEYTRIIVALDYDNVTVIANQRKLVRQFQLFNANVTGLELTKDPKGYTVEELQEIIQ